MYHQPPHPHHAKRRKKRPIHGLKTAEVTRGKSGYGFTISGQHPCILSCIVGGSPADCVGLKPGDYLVSVNGLDVSKAGHDEVVRMVGTSTGTLTLQVAENYNSSDSSDDEYNHRTKSSKYPNRVRARSAAKLRFEDKMDKIVADLNQRDRYCPDGHSHDPTLRPLPQPETMHKHGHSRPRLHMPVGAENNEIAATSMQRHQHGSSSVAFKVPFQKSFSVSNVEGGSSKPTIHRVEPKQAFIKSTSQSHQRSHHTGHHEPSSHHHVYNNFSPASLQQIINHSLHSYSEANEAFILQTEDSDALSDSTEDEELNLLPQNSNIKVVVGYIGSIEMPSDANVPHVRIQSIRNAVRRLRVEQKINTLVLMHVYQEGIALSNATGSTVAEYPVDRIAFSGVCPDDKRFFGIVTLHSNDEPDGAASHENFARSSSCHVFMVDPEMNAHNIHAQKAKTFGIRCTVDPHSQRCLEFPRSTTPIILSISNLYQDRLEGALETDVARSQVFANPNRPAERSSSNSSNSDSGLGLCREDNGHDGAVGPDLQLEQPLPPGGQVRWSGNTVHLTHGPIRHLSPDSHTVATLHHQNPLSALSTDENRSLHTSTSSEECFKAADKLNVRAMPNSAQNSPASPRDNLEKHYSAERLRQSMQKLLQARQKHTHEKQSTSDQDSQSSKENNSAKKKQHDRPISAPFQYLSGESNVDNQQKVDSNKVETVEMNLADKLSPRAFLSSVFTPVGSASSAFRKVKSSSSSLMNQIRSPSAPPIPNYHGDDEDSDNNDDVNLIIERFERDRALGLTVEAEPRRYSEGFALAKTRDSDKKNSVVNTEKWTKGGGSVRQKTRQRTSLSQSHESLVVIDTDPLNHRLSTANSVNSIVNHVQEEEEKEEVGRVAGWAVNFDKLLRDSSGIRVFTEFLKKEFSEENIIFWITVEKYKQITNQDMRKMQGKDIFNKHLSVRASEPVNIDSVARQQADSQMDIPTPQIFDMAQHQIYQLMKQDSYARFLKSELYKTCLLKEMEGKPLDIPQEENKNRKETDEKEKDSKKKTKGKENEDKEKRRRSLLPWRQKASKNSMKSSSDAEAKKSKGKEKDKEREVNNNTKKSTSTTTALPTDVTPNLIPSVGISLSTTRKEVQANWIEEPIPDEAEQPKFCRVILPDGSTTVVCAKAGQTINIVLGKLCEKRNISIASVDIFLLGSDKPLNLAEDIAMLGSKEVIIEKRVLFRMDLPNKKSIGVKAKPNRVIQDVFKPILHKYGFRIDSIEIYLSGHTTVLDLEGLVSSLDNQRVVVVSKDDSPAWTGINGPFITSTRPPLPNKLNKYGYRSNKNRGNSLDDITNQIFGDLMQGKSELAHNFDELGILDPDKTVKDTKGVDPLSLGLLKKESTDMAARDHGKIMAARDHGKIKTRPKVTFALQKNEVRKHPNDDDDLCHLLKTASSRSLDDQRGVSMQDLELPEFLRKSERPLSGRDSAPPMLMRDFHESTSMKRSADMMASEIEDFVHTENDKFVAYTRERTPAPQRTSSQNDLDNSFKPFVSSPSEKLDFTDRSFSTDGVIPTEEEADSYFDFPLPSNTDFDDPLLTEKSLKDIGFSYSHNKYLAKSRNFVSHRSHHTRSGSPSVKNLESPLMSQEKSPNRTLCGDDSSELSDSLDVTVVMSPRLLMSPRDDSGQNKENTAISAPGLNLKSVQKNSRHTLIHSNSPITTENQTDSLSAVDTDSKITRTKLSTPKKLHSSGTAIPNQTVVYLSDSETDVTYV